MTLDAMVVSALRIGAGGRAATACARDQIILSAKVSGVQDLIDVYRDAGRASAIIRCTWG